MCIVDKVAGLNHTLVVASDYNLPLFDVAVMSATLDSDSRHRQLKLPT
jgi:hypothetical protein